MGGWVLRPRRTRSGTHNRRPGPRVLPAAQGGCDDTQQRDARAAREAGLGDAFFLAPIRARCLWAVSISVCSVRCLDEGSRRIRCHLRMEDRMRKIVAIENVTLDGIADSQEGLGFEWTARGYDDEVDRYSNEHVRADVDMAMYGRATYLGMEGFWSKMLDNPDATAT